MAEEINKPENRGYADNGTPRSRKRSPGSCSASSASRSTRRREVNHCIGSKPALAMLPAVFINPGDITLMTVPGYPVAGTHTAYYGGVVYKLPLLAENDFLPDLDSIPADVLREGEAAGALLPQQPDRQDGAAGVYERAIAFAKKHEIVVVQDAAHAHAVVRPAAEQLSVDPRGDGRRRRGPLDVQGLRHDRLAARLGLRQRPRSCGRSPT